MSHQTLSKTKYLRLTGYVLALVCAVIFMQGCGQTTSKAPTEAWDHFWTGYRLLDEGRKAEALKEFEKAVDAAPLDLDIHRHVAADLFSKDMQSESLPYLKRAVDIPPKGRNAREKSAERLQYSEFYTLIGRAEWSLNHIEQAEEAYRQAIKINSRNAMTFNDWGYMYADLGIKLDESLRLTRRAVELWPAEGSFVDSLGWAHFKRGEYKEAVHHLRKAAELTPGNAEVRYHLGMAYEKANDPDGAYVEYSKSLAISPTYKASRDRLKTLRR